MSLVSCDDAAMLCVAHSHVVIVSCIGVLTDNLEDAGEHLWNCNSVDEPSPQLMVVSCFFGGSGGVGDVDDHSLPFRGFCLLG